MRHVHDALASLDRLVVRTRVRDYSWIVLAFILIATAWYAAAGDYPISAAHDVVLPDFQARWTGARLLLDGRADVLYDPGVQAELQQRTVPGSVGVSWFVSPPVTAVLYLPYALLPYATAAALRGVALVVMLAAAVLAGRRLAPGGRDYRVIVLAFLASPPVLEVLVTGQDSIGVLLVLVAAIRLLLAGRDRSAGLVLSLGVFKPHLFVLAPVALLMQRRWRAAATCALGSVALVGATLPVVGLAPWRAWLNVLASDDFQAQVQGGQAWLMQGLPSLFTELGSPHWVGYPVLLAGAALLALRLRGETDTLQVWALTLLTTVAVSPHVLTYDLVVLLPVMVYAHRVGTTRSVRLTSVALVLVLWSAGPRHIAVAQWPEWWLLGVPWSALGIAWVWWSLLRTQVREPVCSSADN